MSMIVRCAMRVLIGGAVVALLAGCHMEQRTPPPEPLDETPIKVDGAMQEREWPPSLAYYASDRVLAGSAYSPLRADRELTWPLNVFSETGVFMADTIYILGGVFIEPPWEQFTYKSMSMPPTHTAMPPLPAGAEHPSTYTPD
jgi:hypothetical protein